MRAPLLIAAFAAALLAASPAAAQTSQATLAGRWSFQTVKATPNGCVITGQALLTPTRGPNLFNVQLTTHEICDTGDEWRSSQNCVATRTGNSVGVDCEVVRAEPSNYAPDDFALRVVSAGLMEGELLSSWNARARWVRDGADLVS